MLLIAVGWHLLEIEYNNFQIKFNWYHKQYPTIVKVCSKQSHKKRLQLKIHKSSWLCRKDRCAVLFYLHCTLHHISTNKIHETRDAFKTSRMLFLPKEMICWLYIDPILWVVHVVSWYHCIFTTFAIYNVLKRVLTSLRRAT